MSEVSNTPSVPPEIAVLIIRLLQESYIDLEAPGGKPRFLVDGATYNVTAADTKALDKWLVSVDA